MANFYLDTPELKHHLSHPLMKRIVELKERNYADKDNFDYAPVDFEDAMDSYNKVLEIVGEICGDIIAPNAEGVDHEGPVCANNRVTYASGTAANLEACRKAGLMGMAMPRRFGGLMPDSRTFGDCRIVQKQFMNSQTKIRRNATSPVCAKVKPCLWT